MSKARHWLIDPETYDQPLQMLHEAKEAWLAETGLTFAAACRPLTGPVEDILDDEEAPPEGLGAAVDTSNFGGKEDPLAEYRPYTVLNGTLIIPVTGMLINKFGFSLAGWLTGYEYIQMAMLRGLEDPNVIDIALDIESGGGTVAGLFDMIDDVRAALAANPKPVHAYASGYGAYSAAYAVACLADEIIVERTSGTGSVGVIQIHVDHSGALKQAGLKVTIIRSGKFKAEGNPYEPLSPGAEKRLQKQSDAIYDVFVNIVSEARKMSTEAVKNTEALTYSAEDSIKVSFADRIGRLSADLSRRARTNENTAVQANKDHEHMATQITETEVSPEATEVAELPEAASETAVSVPDADTVRAQERARFGAVLASTEYTGREAMAAILLATDLGADAIIAALASAPAPVSAAQSVPQNVAFVAAMNANKTGKLTNDEPAEPLSEDEAAFAKFARMK